MADTPLGRFCWFELLVPDPDAAPSFYGPLTGWGTAPFDVGGEPYTMWMNGETPVGGTMQLPQEAIEGGAPPFWLAHISTPDLDATTAKAIELGGTAMAHVEVPEVGKFTTIADPHGAVFSAYQPTEGAPGHDGPGKVGEFSWHELMAADWEAAWDFYSELFGWEKSDQMDMGDMGTYQMFGRGAHPIGGMMTRTPEMPPPTWLYYVRVADIDDAVAKVKEGGGQVLTGPMDVPDGDKVAQCMDPQGAAFAIHWSAMA